MFLHIGSDVSVPLREVVAILGAEVMRAPASREFLALAKNADRLRVVTDQPAKSFIITREHVFLSPISSMTLLKRAARGSMEGSVI